MQFSPEMFFASPLPIFARDPSLFVDLKKMRIYFKSLDGCFFGRKCAGFGIRVTRETRRKLWQKCILNSLPKSHKNLLTVA